MKTSVEIQNLKCGGCSNTIKSKLNAIENVRCILVDVEKGTVSFEYKSEAVYEKVKKTLAKLGYPLANDKNTFGRKTKSYISCAMGKMGN